MALITGFSSRIGKAIALLFAEEGANVIICSNTSSEAGNKVLQEVKEKGSDAYTWIDQFGVDLVFIFIQFGIPIIINIILLILSILKINKYKNREY